MNSAADKLQFKAAKQPYSPSFFSDAAPSSLRSARVVLGLLSEIYRPISVLDVGCGSGSWLAAAEELGATRLVGLDGDWVDPKTLLSSQITFNRVDLERGFRPDEKFDLCISVEVAEHLSPESAKKFVNELCAASEVVLFSAAIKWQGGVMHINEQRQSYWANLFDAAGYRCYDLFRPRLWNDSRVDRWYRQNALLFIKRSIALENKVRSATITSGPLDIVHPEVYEANLENYRNVVEAPTLRFCLQSIQRWSVRQLKQ